MGVSAPDGSGETTSLEKRNSFVTTEFILHKAVQILQI